MKKLVNESREPEYVAIAFRLKELRKSKGYSNYEHIAFELGMSRSAYWRLETGVNFELKTLIKICKLLNISLANFFKDINLPINYTMLTAKLFNRNCHFSNLHCIK